MRLRRREKNRLLLEAVEKHPVFQQALAMAGVNEAGMSDIMSSNPVPPANPAQGGGAPVRESDIVKKYARMQGAAAPFGLRSPGETAGGNT